MKNEYWVDDDGYIAYGTGDNYVTVAEIIDSQHVEPLTKIIEAQAQENTPPDPQHGREPEHGTLVCELPAPKPLAQYLGEYIEYEIEDNNIDSDAGSDALFLWQTWQQLLEQALDAYESIENVKIRIERV